MTNKPIMFSYTLRPLSKSRSGDQIHAYYLAKYLSKNCPLIPSRYKYKEIDAIKNELTIKSKSYGTSNNILINELIELINAKRRTISAFYARFEPRISIFLVLIAKRTLKTKIIFEVNGVFWEEGNLLRKSSIAKSIYCTVLRKADHVIFVSSQIKKAYEEYMGEMINSSVVQNGIEPSTITQNKKNHGDKIQITFVGNLAEWQGLDTAIKAIKILSQKKSKKSIFLHIVGDGSEKQTLEKLTKKLDLKNVYFTGKLSHNNALLHISKSDICIAPLKKRRKASPIKIYEYLQFGKPVISSRNKDVENLNLPGITYFEAENANSLSLAIEAVINNLSLETDKAKMGRDMILSKNTWSKTAEKVHKIINEI